MEVPIALAVRPIRPAMLQRAIMALIAYAAPQAFCLCRCRDGVPRID